MIRSFHCVLVACLAAACGPSVGPPDVPDADTRPLDIDGDGFVGDEDCNEADDRVNVGAAEQCNQFDDNCNGLIDEGYDNDADGWTQCLGDCNDLDPLTHPGAIDLCDDGNDSDCDPSTSSDFDNDGDGWSICDGDCNDEEPLVNPLAVEVQVRVLDDGTEEVEGVDNDCDGLVDEPFEPCDTGLMSTVTADYVKAMDICGPWVTSATFWSGGDTRGRSIASDYGTTYVPHGGSAFAVISSGIAADMNTTGYVNPQTGTAFTNTHAHPAPLPSPGDGCGYADSGTVNDYTELDVEMVVPPNALSFSFDFNFMSAEFPEWVCTSFDDTFVVLLESAAFTGNISFDALGHPVSVNIGFFDTCDASYLPGYPTRTASCTNGTHLTGTGYRETGGGTGWLTTTAPVEPGETIHIKFSVFDEGDHSWDSAVLLDNFRWQAQAVDAPMTIPRLAP